MDEPIHTPEVYPATIDKSGRVTLPAELRRPLNIDQDTELSWVKDESGLRLRTFEESIREIQDYFMSRSPPEDVWSETLIAERKQEAAKEYAEYQRSVGEENCE